MALDWKKIGTDTASNAISGLLGGLGNWINLGIGRLINGKDWYNAQIGKQLSGSEREQNDFNAEQAEINRDFNSEEAEKNRQFQLDFYNNFQSPMAMVQQYQDAGINPASVFGNITAPSSPSGATAAGSVASGSGGSLGSMGLMELLDLAQQSKRLNIETRLQNRSLDAQDRNLDIQEYRSQTERMKAEADIDESKSRKEGYDIQNRFQPELFRQQIEQNKINYENTLKGIHLLDSEIERIAQQNEESRQRIIESRADVALKQFELVIMDSTNDKLRAETDLINLEVAHEEWDKRFRDATKHEPSEGLWQWLLKSIGNEKVEWKEMVEYRKKVKSSKYTGGSR